MQDGIPSISKKKALPIDEIENASFTAPQKTARSRQIQFPAVASADGEATGAVGATGAIVSAGSALWVGCIVTTGAALLVGTAVGAFVGIVALPRTEHVQPAKSSSTTSSGMKKNRVIERISFRFFSDSVSRSGGVMRLRRKKKYAILPV